jgi:hypothetical protein
MTILKEPIVKRLLLVVLMAAVPVVAQAPVKHIMLSPKSNLDTASVSEGFAKYCPNVLVTENEGKADYILEAVEKTTYEDGDSSKKWHFTLLSKDGDILMTTHPKMSLPKYKHHFQDVCKFINGQASAR